MSLLANIAEDCRFAARIFRKSPGFHFVAAGSMALGIGSAVAIFSLAWAVLINPFPYRDPGSILATSWFDGHNEWSRLPFHVADADQIRRDARSVSAVFYSANVTVVATGGVPEQLRASALSPNTFTALGAGPAAGRFFSESDVAIPASPPLVTVLSYRLWQRLYGGDISVPGKSIELDHRQYTILGVAPEQFTWEEAQLYLPQAVSEASRSRVSINVRTRPGVPESAINGELERFTAEFSRRRPNWYPPHFQFRVRSLNHFVFGGFSATVGVLAGASGLLLLIACGNVSILLLARAGSRAKEIAIRIAMGASRVRLFRQVLTESILLALLGAAGGVVLARAGVPALQSIMPPDALPEGLVVHLNSWALAFALSAAVVTGVLFGCAPALHLARTSVREAMQESSRGSTGGGSALRLRNILVVAQVALCAALLTVAGVAVRGFRALNDVPLGFDPSHVLMATTDIRGGVFPLWEERKNHLRRLRDAVMRLPGVEAVTATLTAIPPRILWPEDFELPGSAPGPNQRMMLALVDGDYFATMKIPILRGRGFTPEDIDRPRNVLLVNDAAARTFWPGQDPVGKVLSMSDLAQPAGNFVAAPAAGGVREIIGVVGTALNNGLLEPAEPAAYLPFSTVMGRSQTLLIRTRGDPQGIVTAAREAVRAVDPDQPLIRVTTLEQNLDKVERGTSRFTASLFAAFGGVALLLAASGIFSVISYAVTLRTAEFGVRVALGATPASVARLVLGLTIRLVLSGLILGVAASAALSGWIARYLKGFNPKDPVAITIVILVLMGTALIAILGPLFRAMAAQPLDALRHE